MKKNPEIQNKTINKIGTSQFLLLSLATLLIKVLKKYYFKINFVLLTKYEHTCI